MRDVSTREGLTWTGTLVSKPYVHMVGSIV